MSELKKSDRKPSPEEKALFLAEARKADAEAKAAEAIALKQSAEAEKLRHEAEGARLNSLNIALQYDENKRMTDNVLAGDSHNRLYRFVTDVNEVSAQVCMATLARWSRLSPKCDIEIVFNSPGGSIIEGFALFDFIQDLRRSGHKIKTKTIGYAASMAGVLLQAGDERVMGRESWILIHEASFGAGYGKIGAVEDTVDWVKKMCERIAEIFADRAAKTIKGDKKKILAFVKKNWERKDFWISAPEALKYGFVDRIE